MPTRTGRLSEGASSPTTWTFEAALRREVMEEIGARIGPVTEVLSVTEPGGATTVVEHYFLADLLDMRLDRRHGPELDSPIRATSSRSVSRCECRP